jgi:hypothetical protein
MQAYALPIIVVHEYLYQNRFSPYLFEVLQTLANVSY